MIILNGRKIPMSWEEKEIGFDNDNAVEKRQFKIRDNTLSEFNFKLDIKAKGAVGIVDLEKTLTADGVVLTWEIRREQITEGRVLCQIRAFSANDEVWHSEIAEFTVGKSINATDYFPPELPSEFEQLERRVTQAADRAEAAMENYEIPTASETVKGGVKIGSGLAMIDDVLVAMGGGVADSVEWDNILNKPDVLSNIPTATKNTLGGIKVGENLTVDANGVLSVETTSQVGEDNTKPMTAAGVYTELGNIKVLLSTI